jgi:spore germination protein KC
MKISFQKRLVFVILLIFLSSILLSGCAIDKSELSEIAPVMGIGVDKIPGDRPVLVTLEIAGSRMGRSSSDMSQTTAHSNIETSKGKTFSEALDNFSKSNSLIMDFSHAKTIVLSKEFCESGVSELLDYMDRDRELRTTNWLLVSDKTAREVLESKISNEDILSRGLANMMTQYKKDGPILPISANDFIIETESESKTGYIPLVEIEKSHDDSKGKIKIEKMAIFKNNHLIGVLSNEESKALSWIAGGSKGHIIMSPAKSTSQNSNISLKIYRKHTAITPRIIDGQPHIQIECTGTASIKEVQSINLSPEEIGKIEADTEALLIAQLNNLIHKSQKDLNADFIGFSKNIFNNYPKEWNNMKKDWDEIFPNVKYDINFKIKLNKVGLNKNMDYE